MSDFQSILTEAQAVIKSAKERVKDAFLAELKQVFVRHPEIKMMTWTQYTPYFNDGDACTFRVGEVYFSNYDISHYGEYESDDDTIPDDFFSHYLSTYSPTEGYEDLAPLAKFMNSSEGEDILLFMFDDHASVVVTKDGAIRDEYDHD